MKACPYVPFSNRVSPLRCPLTSSLGQSGPAHMSPRGSGPDHITSGEVDMEHQTLIEAAATAHGLPVRLVSAVVGVESGGDACAFRYEPKFFERYIRGNPQVRAVRPCSLETERTAQATSWGLMQVMGATARGLGYQGAFLSELTRPEVGLEYGCRLLAKLAKRREEGHGWPGVVAAYNAGSVRITPEGGFVNQSYVDKIAQALGGEWPK